MKKTLTLTPKKKPTLILKKKVKPPYQPKKPGQRKKYA